MKTLLAFLIAFLVYPNTWAGSRRMPQSWPTTTSDYSPFHCKRKRSSKDLLEETKGWSDQNAKNSLDQDFVESTIESTKTADETIQVCDQDGTLVALGTISYKTVRGKNILYIDHIASRGKTPSDKGSGPGTELVNSIKLRSNQTNCATLVLHALPQAVGFYKKMGFTYVQDSKLAYEIYNRLGISRSEVDRTHGPKLWQYGPPQSESKCQPDSSTAPSLPRLQDLKFSDSPH